MAVEPFDKIARLLIHASGKSAADRLQGFAGLERFRVEVVRGLGNSLAQLGCETRRLAFDGLGDALKAETKHVVHGREAFVDVFGALKERGIDAFGGCVCQLVEALALDIEGGGQAIRGLCDALLDRTGAFAQHAVHGVGSLADRGSEGAGAGGELEIQGVGAFGDCPEQGGGALVEA